MARYTAPLLVLGITLVSQGGCANPNGPPGFQSAPSDLYTTIAANQIRVVAPFTVPTSFDDDQVPEGIEVVVEALDPQGEPTKLAGQMIFELYDHRPASADPRGQLLQTWQLPLVSRKDQKSYWNRMTRLYAFPLQVDPQSVARRPKYVIVARYVNPWSEYIEDQATIDLSRLTGELRDELRGTARP